MLSDVSNEIQWKSFIFEIHRNEIPQQYEIMLMIDLMNEIRNYILVELGLNQFIFSFHW